MASDTANTLEVLKDMANELDSLLAESEGFLCGPDNDEGNLNQYENATAASLNLMSALDSMVP